MVRTAGHVIAQASLASIRFAVERLGARTVVVLGHEDCGAVSAALAGDAAEWLARITKRVRMDEIEPDAGACRRRRRAAGGRGRRARPRYRRVLREFLDAVEPAGAETAVVGAAYELASGQVRWLD